MVLETWTRVDRYIENLFSPADPVLDATLEASRQAGFPTMEVTPNQGKLLSILARSIQAKSILEIGSLGGYSTIWLGRSLAPGGKMLTLEVDPTHAAVTRANLKRAGLDGVVELKLGLALDTLPGLVEEGQGLFDLVFIDADKPRCAEYFSWALKLTHPGSLIITDNVVRNVAVSDPNNRDPNVQGVRRFNEALAAEPRVVATAVQTVGSKGYDGFAIAVVTS